MLERLTTISVDVVNFALVTYAVPASRVRRLVPSRLTLETFVEGEDERCLVSATCFCNERFRWSALPHPHFTFDESTYRTYVTHRGRRGAFFLQRYLGKTLAWLPQRLFDMKVSLADFDVRTDRDDDGYTGYSCEVRSGDVQNNFTITATEEPAPRPPFSTGDEIAQHITYRLHGFFIGSPSLPGHMPVSHRRMRPRAGRLSSARFDTWERLGVLNPDEVTAPYSVLVEPRIHFLLHPPRPLR